MNGARILLVIGNLYTLRLLTDLLVAAGARVSGTSSREQGSGCNHPFRPDLVIMDLEMVGLDGGQAEPHIGLPPQTPTILLTTLGEQYCRACGVKLDGVEYFSKPFSVAALLARAQEMLYRGSGSVSARSRN
jgi:DNA-binding response OmpR family regulator